jgi:dihydrofolate reductase
MTKCSVFVATSLDGFISRMDGRIDWLEQANTRLPKGEDLGYAGFMANVDALVMGRKTFEQVLSFGNWPYGSTPVVVLSHRLRALPKHLPATVSLSKDRPAELVERLSAQGRNSIYVDGGVTIQGFIAAGLIDELTITFIPVLIGAGKALFGRLVKDVMLELVSSQAYECGFVQSKYRVIKGK